MDENHTPSRRRMLFRCFPSNAVVNGEPQPLDSWISAQMKRNAVYRGFDNGSGRLRDGLNPLEKMVVRMRDATTGESYNHEWWADWVSSPEWFKNLHKTILENWLFYPPEGSCIDPKKLGEKIGYELEYKRRKLERAAVDSEFVENWKTACGFDPEPIELPEELKGQEVRHTFLIDGYADWQVYAKRSLVSLGILRGKIFALQSQLGNQLASFAEGFARGVRRAEEVNLDDDLFGTDDRAHILRILEHDYERISQLLNQRRIVDHIIDQLPARRRQFFSNEIQRKAFAERLRNTYFSKIELRPAARGAPPKSGNITPKRSRIIVITPDTPSEREQS
jgi:hypothetical protein